MRVKAELNTHLVDLITGKPSLLLAEHCPDQRTVFPFTPCTNRGCAYAVRQKGYMHCSFVAAEAGENTLDQIGEMIGITREGVRLIELRGLRKLKQALREQEDAIASVCQPNPPPGESHIDTACDVAEREDQGDSLRVVHGRKLVQRGR